jgi:vitamin K-dependent gamma-carboxylase-like protein
VARLTEVWDRWWFRPVPLERAHVFRVLIYLYVPLDVATSKWVMHHGLVPSAWYEPLWIARALHVPAPTPAGMAVVVALLLTVPLLGALGYARRVVGPAVALLYLYWSFVAFTFGKVDHDRVALLTALAVLCTVPWRGTGTDARAGWALSMVQMSFMLTYFLAGVTKLLVGGPGWVTSTTLERAITRRGTMFGDVLLHFPRPTLYVMQFAILAFELTSPLMLLRNRLGRLYVLSAIVFHIASLIGITIYFRSHLICVIAFFPLERLARLVRRASSAVELEAGPGTRVIEREEDDQRNRLSEQQRGYGDA